MCSSWISGENPLLLVNVMTCISLNALDASLNFIHFFSINYIMIYILLIILIFIIALGVGCGNKYLKGEKFQIYNRPCLKKLEKNCFNDPLTLAKCHITKEDPCPAANGSYMQCTNNFKHDVNIANCLERSYYYSAPNERLSEKCVYKKVFPFATKKYQSTSTPSIFPRVNIYRNKDLPNNFFVNM